MTLVNELQFPQGKKKEPKKKETAAAILPFLLMLSVQYQGCTAMILYCIV